MAKYTITYSCGHTAETSLTGNTERRRSYIAWAEKNGRCPACGNSDAAAKVDEFERRHALPELTGSAKQVKWARDLRFGMYQSVIDYLQRMSQRCAPEAIDDFAKVSATVLARLAARHEAKDWIERRDVVSAQKLAADVWPKSIAECQ